MLSQLEERASAPVGDRDSEYRSPNLWDGLQRETFIQWLRELPGQVRDYQCAPKVQAVIAWVQSNYSGNGDGQPFLSRNSGLWFQTGWLKALEGKIFPRHALLEWTIWPTETLFLFTAADGISIGEYGGAQWRPLPSSALTSDRN